jgi:uncharacterized surface protein with fasciclin (FAS1) repeats
VTKRTILSLAVAAAAVVPAACSGDDDTSDTTPATVATSPVTEPTSTRASTTESTSTEPATDVTGTDTSPTDPSSTDAGAGPSSTDLADVADDVRGALADGDFSTMLDLLDLSGLSDEVEDREITVLAPSEDAFRAVSSDELADLVTDPERAKDVLRRHVLEGVYTYDELADLTEVTTIGGDTLPIEHDGDVVTVAGATVSPPAADAVAGEDGQEIAVFEIDAVLLPAT